MGANVKVRIESPHGGKTVMDLNPEQVAILVEILDGHRDLRGGAFGPWFVHHIAPHAKEGPTPIINDGTLRLQDDRPRHRQHGAGGMSGREEERAAVVAWLRGLQRDIHGIPATEAYFYSRLATAIERGEHLERKP